MKFNSQICTTREQSERLLSLGLKKETADMVLTEYSDGVWRPSLIFDDGEDGYDASPFETIDIHAWSLHRLIEMMPNKVRNCGYVYELNINRTYIHYSRYKTEIEDYVDLEGFSSTDSLYDIVISMLEWLINEEYFPKEYLEE